VRAQPFERCVGKQDRGRFVFVFLGVVPRPIPEFSCVPQRYARVLSQVPPASFAVIVTAETPVFFAAGGNLNILKSRENYTQVK
jgi:hypothetical protein